MILILLALACIGAAEAEIESQFRISLIHPDLSLSFYNDEEGVTLIYQKKYHYSKINPCNSQAFDEIFHRFQFLVTKLGEESSRKPATSETYQKYFPILFKNKKYWIKKDSTLATELNSLRRRFLILKNQGKNCGII